MPNQNKDLVQESSQANINARANIGKNVIYFSLTTVGLLGLAAIVAACFIGNKEIAKEQFGLIRDTFTLLLPVLGTWVGTVLAFYFSRENFAEAAKQTANLVRQLSPDQKLQEIPVIEAMISLEDINTAKLVLDKNENDIKIREDIIENIFKKLQKNRLPVVDTTGKVIYIIHRSIVDKYVAEQVLSGNSTVTAATLNDLILANNYRQIATAFGTVSKTTKLISVKNQIDSNPDCADVFVTEDGTKNSRAIGWITNVIVAEKSKL